MSPGEGKFCSSPASSVPAHLPGMVRYSVTEYFEATGLPCMGHLLQSTPLEVSIHE